MGKIIFLLFCTGIAAAFAFLILRLNNHQALRNAWIAYDTDKHELASFCERTEWDKPVRQPVNTFSHIAYLLAGIVILKKEITEKKILLSDKLTALGRSYRILLGGILFYVFFAGSFYHASLINLSLKLDYSGVFLIALFPLMYFFPRWSESREAKWRLKQKGFHRLLFSSFFILWLLLSIFIPGGKLGIAAVVVIFLLVAVVYVIEKENRGKANLKHLILSIISVLVAFLWFELDRFKILCNPQSWIQPHALWNVFIGIAALCFYFYMSSEKKDSA